MCARFCISPNSSTDSSPQNVLTYNNIISLGSYTVLIDLGLTELHNVRDSAAPRSYVDSRSQAFSERGRGSARLGIKPREERVRYLLVASWAT